MPSESSSPDLIFFNARVITQSKHRPTAELVAVKGDRIVWVGSNGELGNLARSHTRVIDCQGQTLVPGFIDAHCHLMAYASRLMAVDCSSSAVASIEEIKGALREGARHAPPGQWVRAYGYDEFALTEQRHPSRWDLDEAVADRPVRLNHRSGHACVLNSAALAQVGITASTPDPVGGVIERDPGTAQPTGLLMEMDDYLDGLIPPLNEQELRRGVRLASDVLVSLGITSVQDATASNSVERWEVFRRLKEEGVLMPRVTMMAGAGLFRELKDGGLGFGAGDSDLNLGAVKITLSMTSGTLHPSTEELRDMVAEARGAGFQVAIHAVEVEAVEAVAEAFLGTHAPSTGARLHTRDRIEHCSECPPAALERLAGSGVVVVTQPGFLYYSGRRYLSEVAQEVQPWLYRIGSILKAGLCVAFGSDAPVIDPNPLIGIYAAVTRRAETGEAVGESDGISAQEALRLYTLGGAYAAFQEGDKGSVEVGKLADLVLLDQDPTRLEAEQIRRIKVTLTVIGGRVVWER